MKQEPNWNMPYVNLATLVAFIWLGMFVALILLSWTHASAFLVGSMLTFVITTYASRARNEIL